MNKIPQSELDFAKKLVELAKEHECQILTVEYRGGMTNEFHDTIKVSWNRGRHSAPSPVCVESKQYEYFEI